MPSYESQSQRQQLRLKIKKLKYKIQKQQKQQQQTTRLLTRFKKFGQDELTLERVLKKINFLLEIRGMTMMDWLRAYDYEQFYEIDKLLGVLQRIGVKIPRDQQNLLKNFMNGQFSEEVTMKELKQIIELNGISTKEK